MNRKITKEQQLIWVICFVFCRSCNKNINVTKMIMYRILKWKDNLLWKLIKRSWNQTLFLIGYRGYTTQWFHLERTKPMLIYLFLLINDFFTRSLLSQQLLDIFYPNNQAKLRTNNLSLILSSFCSPTGETVRELTQQSPSKFLLGFEVYKRISIFSSAWTTHGETLKYYNILHNPKS